MNKTYFLVVDELNNDKKTRYCDSQTLEIEKIKHRITNTIASGQHSTHIIGKKMYYQHYYN